MLYARVVEGVSDAAAHMLCDRFKYTCARSITQRLTEADAANKNGFHHHNSSKRSFSGGADTEELSCLVKEAKQRYQRG